MEDDDHGYLDYLSERLTEMLSTAYYTLTDSGCLHPQPQVADLFF
jgi:hypothetical protein